MRQLNRAILLLCDLYKDYVKSFTFFPEIKRDKDFMLNYIYDSFFSRMFHYPDYAGSQILKLNMNEKIIHVRLQKYRKIECAKVRNKFIMYKKKVF